MRKMVVNASIEGLRWFVILPTLLLFGCDDSVIYSDSVWIESKDTIRDGAFRVAAITFKNGRHVIVRCFGATQSDARHLDIRYAIDVPLLKRLEKEFKDKDGVTLSISTDANVARIQKARTGYSGEAFYFLADIDQETVQAIADAKEKIFVIPRMNDEILDEEIEFGAYHAKEHISKVIDACQQKKPEQPSVPDKPGPEKKKNT